MYKNVLLAVVSLLLCLVALEMGVRLYSALAFPKMMVLDDMYGWKHMANAKKIFTNEDGEKILIVQNAHGHRGKLYDFAGKNDAYRILVLGDSFAEGGEVSENDLFSARLEGLHPQLEVINAGVSGYGTVQEYLYLIAEGLKYNPDLVLLMFYENDLTDNCLSYFFPFGPRPYALVENGKVKINAKLEPAAYRKFILPLPFRMTFNRHSYLYYFLNLRYHELFFDKMQRLRLADLSRIGDEKYELFYGLLDLMHNRLNTAAIDFAVVLIPTREEAGHGYSATVDHITDFCRARRIKFIPLLETFQQKARSGEKMYFPIDIHWTGAGHRAAAEEIARHIAPHH